MSVEVAEGDCSYVRELRELLTEDTAAMSPIKKSAWLLRLRMLQMRAGMGGASDLSLGVIESVLLITLAVKAYARPPRPGLA